MTASDDPSFEDPPACRVPPAERLYVRLCSPLSRSLSRSLARAQTSPEVQITTAPVWDFEFDSARNGKECPSCNFNNGNSRLSWIDNDRNLWLAWVDFQTGAFVPPDGKGQLIDVGAVPIATFGNGPEWMFSSTLRLTDRLHKVSPRPGRQAGQGDDRGRDNDAQ